LGDARPPSPCCCESSWQCHQFTGSGMSSGAGRRESPDAGLSAHFSVLGYRLASLPNGRTGSSRIGPEDGSHTGGTGERSGLLVSSRLVSLMGGSWCRHRVGREAIFHSGEPGLASSSAGRLRSGDLRRFRGLEFCVDDLRKRPNSDGTLLGWERGRPGAMAVSRPQNPAAACRPWQPFALVLLDAQMSRHGRPSCYPGISSRTPGLPVRES